MADTPEAQTVLTPSIVVTALLGFLAGAASLGYNPFWATSVIAIALSVLTLRSARGVRHDITQGMLRILAILGIMSGVGGIMVLAFPGLGVTPA